MVANASYPLSENRKDTLAVENQVVVTYLMRKGKSGKKKHNTGSNNNNFSPIKHNKQTASSSAVINNDMDDTPIILEDARKAIERLRILNSIDNKEDGMDVEPPPPPPSPPPQSSSLLRRISTITLPEQTIKTNEQIAKFLYALHLVENSELLNEIFRLHSIQIEEMPTFDFKLKTDRRDDLKNEK